jgi:hypothetical protein
MVHCQQDRHLVMLPLLAVQEQEQLLDPSRTCPVETDLQELLALLRTPKEGYLLGGKEGRIT